MKYKVILFDVDDTLLDFPETERNALHNAFVQFGMPTGYDDYLASYKEISNGLWRDLENKMITLSELAVDRFRQLFALHNIEVDAQQFSDVYLENLGKEVHLIEGAVQLCENLQDCKLGIITNGYTKVQQSRIGSSPLCNFFEHIIISEEVGHQKPAREIFDYAFEKFGITDKSSVLMVGDSLTSDMKGGEDYGIDTCWYNPSLKENTTSVKPTYEVESLLQILEIVEVAEEKVASF